MSDIEKSPVRTVLRRDWLALLLGIGVVAGSTGFNYVHKVYMPTYALTQLHFPPVSSYLGAAVTGLVQAITGPMFGALSDRVGRHRAAVDRVPAGVRDHVSDVPDPQHLADRDRRLLRCRRSSAC